MLKKQVLDRIISDLEQAELLLRSSIHKYNEAFKPSDGGYENYGFVKLGEVDPDSIKEAISTLEMLNRRLGQ